MTATFIVDTPPLVQIDFSEPLLPDASINFANWPIRWTGNAYNVTAAEVSGSTVVLEVEADIPDPGADVVSYTPPPADVITLGSGIPVALFTDFPLGTA